MAVAPGPVSHPYEGDCRVLCSCDCVCVTGVCLSRDGVELFLCRSVASARAQCIRGGESGLCVAGEGVPVWTCVFRSGQQFIVNLSVSSTRLRSTRSCSRLWLSQLVLWNKSDMLAQCLSACGLYLTGTAGQAAAGTSWIPCCMYVCERDRERQRAREAERQLHPDDKGVDLSGVSLSPAHRANHSLKPESECS